MRNSFWRRKLKSLRATAAGPIMFAPLRLQRAARYYTPKLSQIMVWLWKSREDDNFTYRITDVNQSYLAHMLSVISGCPYDCALGYLREPSEDTDLQRHVMQHSSQKPFRYYSDARCEFGRRIGWYAMARLMKPKVIVETGVDKGLGSALLCSALLRNGSEGCPGQYYGTDINPKAGYLLRPPYDSVGQILYGDSIESLRTLDGIELFINDSDHSAEYEGREYQIIVPKLTDRAIILADNAHCTGELALFSRSQGREFLFFREEPAGHWYPGSGIGFSFPARVT